MSLVEPISLENLLTGILAVPGILMQILGVYVLSGLGFSVLA